MKVGLIGLGRMGEGMSRRMMKQGIEVYGYRRNVAKAQDCLLYTSPSPRDQRGSRMPSSA